MPLGARRFVRVQPVRAPRSFACACACVGTRTRVVHTLVRASSHACRLWHSGQVVVIDVSQSVEREHPRALEFLRMDCQNITDYFRRGGVVVMTPRELFDFVVHASLPNAEEEQKYLEEVRALREPRATLPVVAPAAQHCVVVATRAWSSVCAGVEARGGPIQRQGRGHGGRGD
ncbi:hypothetical protein EON62_04190 [archaeon]|nr:MAG: hypothetical protein EON62_04190 [archaeon]